MAKKKILSTTKDKVTITPTVANRTAWDTVCNAAINFIEAKPKEEWFTKENVLAGIAGQVGPISSTKTEEILNDMIALFVGNHILLVNDKGEYRKFSIEDTPFGKGIQIERKQDGKKDPIDV